jgi:phosphatidylserine/phosphatidylglycerophosphate/cardiolipin synthase-like enzyme
MVSAVAACGGAGEEAAAGSEDLTAADTATVAAANGARTRVYARLSGASATQVGDALVAAAQRGLDVRAVLPAASGTGWDATWLLQQHLESSGVDVDVRTDSPLADVVAVADGTALVPSGTGTQQKTGADAEALAKKFSDLLDGAPASHDGAPIASGTVVVHPMPESTRDRIVALFTSARSSIDLSIYQLQDRAVVGALEAAAGRHVAVRVMLEPKTVGAQNYDPVSKQLAAAGVNVQPTPPRFDAAHNVDHAKFAIVDGKEVLVATGNLVRSGLGGDMAQDYDNRDFWVEDARTPTITAAQQLFQADWERKATPASAQSAFVISPENADTQIGLLVDGATQGQRLWVYNQSLEDPGLVGKLVAAKHRGADVQVLLGYQPAGKNQQAIDQLKAGGCTANFLRKHYLHAKAIVANGRVYIGSQNFTNGGLRTNRELGLVLDDPKAVDVVARTFTSDSGQ